MPQKNNISIFKSNKEEKYEKSRKCKSKKTKKYLIIKKIDIKILLKLENVNLNYSSFELNHSNLINLKKKINYYIIRIN